MPTKSQVECSALILAAGNSSRLGFPKQSVLINGVPLLRKTFLATFQAMCNPIVVISGANFESDKKILNGLDLDHLNNSDWSKGIGGTIKLGINYLMKNYPENEATIILTCDQPAISGKHLSSLIFLASSSSSEVICSSYKETLGTPVLFKRDFFSELLNLNNDEGAKRIINKIDPPPPSIDLLHGELDIDTENDIILMQKTIRSSQK